jgi:HEAT repeat protein
VRRSIEALGAFGGPEAVDALKDALQHTDWLAPLKARRARSAAARALRRIGDDAAIEALRDASMRGSRGARSAARTELGQL